LPCFKLADFDLSSPSFVSGPVDRPPWIQQTCFPHIAGLPQHLLVLFAFAIHRGNERKSQGGLLFLSQPKFFIVFFRLP
jgi:hypothetical protein